MSTTCVSTPPCIRDAVRRFFLLVVLIAILVFLALGHPPLWIRIVSRIALLPVIAGISYEVLRIHGRYSANRFLKVLLGPGLLLQMLTTRRPDDRSDRGGDCRAGGGDCGG